MAQAEGEPFRIKLDVYADVLCPWCYIEKHTLDSVMDRFRQKHPDVEFQVTWRPFYINPLLSRGSSLLPGSQSLSLSI